jgi:hypothetical protein
MTFAEAAFYKDVATVIISLAALGLTIWNGYISREHNKISQRPILTSRISFLSEKPYYKIKNCGNGVAIIGKTSYYINGKGVEYKEFITDYYENGKGFELAQHIEKGTALGINAEISIYEVSKDTLDAPYKLAKKYAIKMQYSSIYGEKFEYVSSSLTQNSEHITIG